MYYYINIVQFEFYLFTDIDDNENKYKYSETVKL